MKASGMILRINCSVGCSGLDLDLDRRFESIDVIRAKERKSRWDGSRDCR